MNIMNMDRGNIRDSIIISIYLPIAIIFIVGLSHATVIEVNPGQSIQKAIDLANPGDTIRVLNGTYTENIEIDKQLTVKGIDMPVIWAKHSGSTINITADGCLIEGIDAGNSSGWHQGGIRITSNNNVIHRNEVKDSRTGIVLQESSGNKIFYNDARNGGTGIFLRNSCDNTIERNEISSHGKDSLGVSYGIYLLNSSNHNIIRKNIIDIGGLINGGIMIYCSEFNSVNDNEITGSGLFSGMGVALLESNNCLIENNTVASNGILGQGIRLMFSHNNTIDDNSLCCYGPIGQAIAILQSENNRISANQAKSWHWGRDIEFEGASGNKLSGNDAIRIYGEP